MEKSTIRLAIFASGNGSNAEQIAHYFEDIEEVEIVRIYSNKSEAYVLERAKNLQIPSMVFSGKELRESDQVLQQLQADKTDYIILAGFLLLIPEYLIQAFPNRIINIHPALLPDYGGKGMYGMNVHKAVKASGDRQTGITIHFVNEHYDEGQVIFQAFTRIAENDSPEDIASKVHALEYAHYPKVIHQILGGADEV
jgi:phosphoribosylglycinamide formyltransferase-1